MSNRSGPGAQANTEALDPGGHLNGAWTPDPSPHFYNHLLL